MDGGHNEKKIHSARLKIREVNQKENETGRGAEYS